PSVLAGRAIGPFHPPHSGEEAINLPAMEAAHKGNRVSLNAQPDAPIADANSIIATLTTQSLQGADLIQRRGFFNVRDRALDPTPNPRIAQLLHVREKAGVKERSHFRAAKALSTASRLTTLLFSPSRMSLARQTSSITSARRSRKTSRFSFKLWTSACFKFRVSAAWVMS